MKIQQNILFAIFSVIFFSHALYSSDETTEQLYQAYHSDSQVVHDLRQIRKEDIEKYLNIVRSFAIQQFSNLKDGAQQMVQSVDIPEVDFNITPSDEIRINKIAALAAGTVAAGIDFVNWVTLRGNLYNLKAALQQTPPNIEKFYTSAVELSSNNLASNKMDSGLKGSTTGKLAYDHTAYSRVCSDYFSRLSSFKNFSVARRTLCCRMFMAAVPACLVYHVVDNTAECKKDLAAMLSSKRTEKK